MRAGKLPTALACAALLAAAAGLSAGQVEVNSTEALKRALRQAAPGTRIVLAGGTYKGGLWAEKVNGTPGAPVVIAAKDPARPPIFRGGRMGFEMARCSYVVLDGLVAERAELNNIQFWNSHHVVLKNCRSRNVAGGGNCDGIKLTAVADFLLHGCTVEKWGAEGSAVDMVACARGLIMKCRFSYPDLKGQTANCIQPKCGAFDIGIYKCRFEDASLRAVQFGGGIGPGRVNRYDYFGKLKQTGYSGVDMAAMGNVIASGGAAVAYVSCANCTFQYNTIVNPAKYVIRILFEGGAEPTARNSFARNLIVHGKLEGVINAGSKTRPESFTFAENYWFSRLRPESSIPALPAKETRPAGGKDPRLGEDFRPAPDGPAAAYGAHAAGLEKAWSEHARRFKWAWQQAKRLQAESPAKPPEPSTAPRR